MDKDPDSSTPADSHPKLPSSWWWLVSALAAALIFGIGGLALVRFLARPLAMLILAVSIASALAPVVEWLTRKMTRTLAVILVYAVLILFIIGVLGATIPL